MSRKFTMEQVRDIFSQVGYVVLENESKGIDYKYKCQDKDGYLYSRSVHSVQACLKKGTGNFSHIFSQKNEYFYENMLHYIEVNVKSGTILLSKKDDIKNIDQQLDFKCGICGRQYKSTWHVFVRNTDKICNVCFKQKVKFGEVKTNHVDTNKFHIEALKNGLTIFAGPEIRFHDKIIVQDKSGYKGLCIASSILHGRSFDRFGKANPYTIDNMRVYALQHGWDCVIYNQNYVSDKTPLKLMCSCGNDFDVDINHFVAGKYQCNECRIKQSAIAAKTELWLNLHDIIYIKEYRYKDCINKQQLPFDFFLPDYNACIEVDGIGHYRPVAFNGDKENAKKVYELRVQNDNIKTEYCKNNNIPLLRIPYWILEKDEHGELLDNFLLSIKPDELDK